MLKRQVNMVKVKGPTPIGVGLFAPVVFILMFLLTAANVHAAPAGTVISNTANVGFDIGGIPSSTSSNPVVITTVAGGTGTTPGMLLSKTASVTSASIGDVLQYRLRFDNTGSGLNLTGAVIIDQLPPGLRYKPGSTKIDGVKAANPVISGNGRTLTFTLGNVASGRVLELRYVVEVLPSAGNNQANNELVNTAIVTASGGLQSNQAKATVKIKEDFFHQKAFLEGRVIVDSCDHHSEAGLKGARIVLEDGTYVITDENGNWHIEGVNPGTHVVQLDKITVPDDYEVVQCEDDSRHADTAFSQFVDVRPGTLWRADFYVRSKAPGTYFSLPARVLFPFNKFEISPAGEEQIKLIADKVNRDNASITIDGHTDIIGTPEYNQGLSEKRAEAIADKLQDYGINEDQITLGAHGANAPAADNKILDGRATNRRVDVTRNVVGYDPVRVAQEKMLKTLEAEKTRETLAAFNSEWLNKQNSQFSWVYPDPTYNPVTPAARIGIKHRAEYTVKLLINGEPVDMLHYDGSEKNTAGTVALTRWAGVPLENGDNIFEAQLIHTSGKEIDRITQVLHFSGEPVKAVFVNDKSSLVADGKQTPIIAIRLTDKDGYPARPGMIGYFTVNEPYRSEESLGDAKVGQLTRQTHQSHFFVGKNGMALLRLEPTTQTGNAVVKIALADNQSEEVRAWLSPGTREWIFVGLAEAEVGEHMVSGDKQGLSAADLNEGVYDENRAAFFAKGQIKGEWLLTAAYDTDKDKNQKFRQIIDPDTYYTLYADNTSQNYDAASTKKLYLKIEKKDYYALFGDYDTGLDETEMSKYTRSATGLKTELNGEQWKANFFATESGQSYFRDEIRGDGTSGLYHLSNTNIVANTDRISIETRDRFRSDKIISVEYLSSHIDYNIDYETGTLYFRKPILSNDSQQNPIYIVAEYETESGNNSDVTAGGRAAYKVNDKAIVGMTAIHEGNTNAAGDLTGVDASFDLTKQLILKTEYATTDKEKLGSQLKGNAYLVELTHDGEKFDSSVYVREQEENFGLGQQNAGESGTRKTGADLRYSLDKQSSINSEISQQDDLVNDATRNVVDATYNYENGGNTAYVGSRYADDQYQTGEQYTSSQMLLGGSTNVMDKKVTLRADSEILINNNGQQGDANNPDYPNRMQLGADYHVTEAVDLLLGQEYSWGDKESFQGTSVGMNTRPWHGAETLTTVGKQTSEYGDRTYANMGLAQTLNINKEWHVDFSANRSQTINETNSVYPTASFNTDQTEDFTAFTVGGGLLTDTREWTTRVETRTSDSDDKTNFFMGYLQELEKGISMSLGVALSDTNGNGQNSDMGDVRYSIAYRPHQSDWNYFNRLDYLWNTDTTANVTTRNRRLVNNFISNYKPDNINQLSFLYGAKYSLDQIDGNDYGGYTDIYSAEYRRNLPQRWKILWDVGMHASSLNGWETGTFQSSYGVSLGMSPQKNMWLSLGYNFEGFTDTDFSGSDYTAEGYYLKFRMKMDQESLRDLWAQK